MSLTFDVHVRPRPGPATSERAEILANPGFGVHFTDHMARATWTKGGGWHDGEVTAYGPITLMPSAAVLHYAQEIFEGLKAYRHEDGSVWSFRPEANAQRMQRSARRLALPELPDGGLPRLAAGPRGGRRGVGPGRRARARPASTCGRSCTPRRRSSASARPTRSRTASSRHPRAPTSPVA